MQVVKMITQGWYESDGNTMYFYQCGFSLPHVVNHLSNYINMLYDGKKTVMLNTNATPFAYEAQDNAAANITSTAEKKKSSNALEKVEKDVAQACNKKGNKVENDNDQKTTSTKNNKCTRKNKKRDELEEKGHANMNRFSRLKEMLGDGKETHEGISEAAVQDENRNKDSNKKH